MTRGSIHAAHVRGAALLPAAAGPDRRAAAARLRAPAVNRNLPFPAPVLEDREFDEFVAFFHDRTGILFQAGRRDFVTKRVMARLAASRHRSFRAWFTALRQGSDPAELQAIANALTINETYFMREKHQFDVMAAHLLPRLDEAREAGEPIRILSLPCSTGEEVYSIAMTILDRWPGIARRDVQIEGVDISTDALSQAVRGVYGPRAVQNVPPEVLHLHFRARKGPLYEVSRDIRDAVRFEQLNVMDRAALCALRPFDIIFCRNMLIYFNQASQRTAVQNMFAALRPGGYLLLGHSESMSRMSDAFASLRFGDAFVWQKPEEESRATRVARRAGRS